MTMRTGSSGSSPPPGQPPSGPPQGVGPGGSAPAKKSRGVRATLYQLRRTLTGGKPKTVKTEVIEKKKKREKDDQGQVAPAPAPVIVHTQEVITHYVPVPVPVPVHVMPGMPAPVTQDDHNFQAYMAQQAGQQAPQLMFTMPQPPVQQMMPMPVIVTTQQQHPFIASQPPTQHFSPQPSFTLSASQPAMFSGGGKDWNTRASECMADLLERLERGGPDEVANGFRFMQDVARERKFTGETIDGWISSALADYPPDALKSVYENAIISLPDSLLANSVRLGIRRMLVPLELINAIMEKDWSKALALADLLLRCCDPAKSGDERPDKEQKREMMTRMLDRTLAKISDEQLHGLSLEVVQANHPAITALRDLLFVPKYWRRIALYADAMDQ
jgi:hypothetical protein